MRTIDLIVIHCADTYAHMDITAADVDRWHREDKDKGWSQIGYHWFIRRNGLVEPGRAEAIAGAHVAGHNANSIGICYAGGKGDNGQAEDNRTPAQKRSIEMLVCWLQKRFPGARVLGHHDLNPAKACPCFDVKSEFRQP